MSITEPSLPTRLIFPAVRPDAYHNKYRRWVHYSMVPALAICVVLALAWSHDSTITPKAAAAVADPGQLTDNVPRADNGSVTMTIKGTSHTVTYVRHARPCPSGLVCQGGGIAFAPTAPTFVDHGTTYTWPTLVPRGSEADYYAVTSPGLTLGDVITKYRTQESVDHLMVLDSQGNPVPGAPNPATALAPGDTVSFS